MINVVLTRKITRGKPSTTWYCRWTCPASRKRIWKSTGFTRRDLAQRFANELQRDLEAGAAGIVKSPSLSAAVEEFLASRKARSRPATITTYRRDLQLFQEIAEVRKVSDVSSRSIDKFVAGMTKKTATVNKCLRTLKIFLRWSCEMGYVRAVPKIQMIREDVRSPIRISREEQRKILEAIGTFPCRKRSRQWWSTIVRLLFYSGLRRNEVLALTWDDVDFSRREICKRAESSKSRTESRIPLSESMAEVLMIWKGVGESPDVVFPVGPAGIRQIWDEWMAITERAVGRRVRWKDARSTAASELADTEALGVVQRWLGHSTPTITAKFYVNSDEAIRRAGDAREAL